MRGYRLWPPKCAESLVEIVPLSTGCLGTCTCYQDAPRARQARLVPLEEIVGRVEGVAEGVTEVWLSSEDTGAYGIDLGTSLSALLRPLTCRGVLGGTDVMLRVGMTNPPYMLDQLDAIAAALSHPNVFSFLHVPSRAVPIRASRDESRVHRRRVRGRCRRTS